MPSILCVGNVNFAKIANTSFYIYDDTDHIGKILCKQHQNYFYTFK